MVRKIKKLFSEFLKQSFSVALSSCEITTMSKCRLTQLPLSLSVLFVDMKIFHAHRARVFIEIMCRHICVPSKALTAKPQLKMKVPDMHLTMVTFESAEISREI